MANRKRSKQVIIRLSDEEYDAYMEQVKQSNLSQNEFFVRCVTGKKIIVVDGLKEAVCELSIIGSALNQICRKSNEGVISDVNNELQELREKIGVIKTTVLDILKRVK